MTIDHVSILRSVSGELGRRAEANPDLPIPECPGWTASDVIRHVGQVYAMVAAIVAERSLEYVAPGPESTPPTTGLETWFAERRAVVGDLLAAIDPDTPVWTWSSNRTAGFYHRRMLHETVVHLGDIERALGMEVIVDRVVALDGIDEFFDVVLPFSLARGRSTLPTGSLHLHCTDGDGEWMVRIEDGAPRLTHEHAKGDVAWRGAASDLYFATWGRWSTRIEALGDPGIAEEWNHVAP